MRLTLSFFNALLVAAASGGGANAWLHDRFLTAPLSSRKHEEGSSSGASATPSRRTNSAGVGNANANGKPSEIGDNAAKGAKPPNNAAGATERSLQMDPPPIDVCSVAIPLEFPVGQTNISVVSQITTVTIADADFCASFPAAYEGYTIVGNGNTFYATTCSSEHNSIRTGLTVSSFIGPANATSCPYDDFACLGSNFGDICPFNQYGAASFIWKTEPNVLYHIGLYDVDETADTYELTIGEIPGPHPANDDCSAAIPLVLQNGTVTVSGSTANALPDGNPDKCFSSVFSTVWYSIVGDGQEFTATTCSEQTTAPTAVRAIRSVDGSCEKLECGLTGFEDFTCGTSQSQGSVSWFARKGATYFIQPIAANPGSGGDFEMTITTSEPSIFAVCDDARNQAVEGLLGTECDFCSFTFDSLSFGCSVPCFACSSDFSVCTQRTTTTSVTPSLVTTTELRIQHTEGPIDDIIYRYADDGTCTVMVGSQTCTSCSVGSCGRPILSCANIDADMPDLDLCTNETSPGVAGSFNMSTSPLYALISSEFDGCSIYESTLQCGQTAAETIEEDGLNCICDFDPTDGMTVLKCNQTCGVVCNLEETICGLQSRTQDFQLDGEATFSQIQFDYLTGFDSSFNSLTVGEFSDSSCFMSASDGWSCDCEPVQCADDSTDLSFSCNKDTESFDYNFCEPGPIDIPVFSVLSEDEFEICLDKSPQNKICQAAILLDAADDFVSSNTGIQIDPQPNFCDSEAVGGLWYDMIGSGEVMKIEPCLGTDEATKISVQTGSCDADVQCMDSTEFTCDPLLLDAKNGTLYHMHFFTPYSTSNESVTFAVSTANAAEAACVKAKDEEEATDELTCTCTSSQLDSASLSCSTSCGEFCNTDVTACGTVSLFSEFNSMGEATLESTTYTYTSGREGITVGLSVFTGDFVFCEGLFTDGAQATSCTLCNFVGCPSGDAAVVLDCSNIDGGEIFDFCGNITVDSDSPFQVFDTDEFELCYANGTLPPTDAPTGMPSASPSVSPSGSPSVSPSGAPSMSPSGSPTSSPSVTASQSPTIQTSAPTSAPTSGAAFSFRMTSMSSIIAPCVVAAIASWMLSVV